MGVHQDLFDLEEQRTESDRQEKKQMFARSRRALDRAIDDKNAAMKLAAESRAEALAKAKLVARNLATFGIHGVDAARGTFTCDYEVTIDDVQQEMILRGSGPGALGNAAGSVFSGGDWERVGSTISTRKGNNGRRISVWRLR